MPPFDLTLTGVQSVDRNEAVTKPTLETILERVNTISDTVGNLRSEVALLRDGLGALRNEFGMLRNEFYVLRDEFGALRTEFHDFREHIGIRLDRIESMTNQTRAEMLTLRADFHESRA
jgi:hypothetical protein